MPNETTIADELAFTEAALGEGRIRWRVWRYRRQEIVLGCSQRALLERTTQRAPAGIAVHLRRSGGGAVFAGPWLVGATVVLPTGHALLRASLADSYRWLGELHVAVLAACGVRAHALSPPEARAGGPAPALAWACFGGLSPWEVVDDRGRKLTGLAQRRRQHAVAFSAGTLISRPRWAVLCAALDAPAEAERLDAVTGACDETCEPPGFDAARFTRRLDDALAARLSEGADA